MTIGPESHVGELSSSAALGPIQGARGKKTLPPVPKDPKTSAGSKPTLTVSDPAKPPDPEEAQKQINLLNERLKNSPAARVMQNISNKSSKLEQGKSLFSSAAPFIRQAAFLALFLFFCASTMNPAMIIVTVALVMGPSILLVGGLSIASKISEYMKAQREEMEKNKAH